MYFNMTESSVLHRYKKLHNYIFSELLIALDLFLQVKYNLTILMHIQSKAHDIESKIKKHNILYM